ncbi:hypothetical protein N9055_03170 [Akkermansiaceae bacterium]|nr:hypothetical protein [bacterium]MDB4507197.1 hypothetical protein [Akkermansiaceae bacterium]MDB4525694.1 hypothetical protein [Akkermansiaceae bacterium]
MKKSLYDAWLDKLRKRAAPSGTISQWSLLLTQKQGGDPEMWAEHLRAVLEEEEKAALELILDLDIISAPVKRSLFGDDTIPLW